MIRFKRSNLCSLFVIFFLYMNLTELKAQQIQLYTSPDSVSIGDVITYTIVLPSGLSYDAIQTPDSSSFGSNVDFLSKMQFKTSQSGDSIEYKLQFFGTENLELNGLYATLLSKDGSIRMEIPNVSIPFKTMLVAEGEEELRPLKDIYDFRINWIPFLLLLIILLISAWVIVRYITKYRDSLQPKLPKEVPYFKDPLDYLEVSLLSLRSDESLIVRDFKSFFTKLGDHLRDYIEIVHQIDALEMTSRELTREMERAGIDRDLIRQITIVLKRADMVKFAKLEPSVDDALESLREAERFVQIARQTDIQRIQILKSNFELEQKKNRTTQELPENVVEDQILDQSNNAKENLV